MKKILKPLIVILFLSGELANPAVANPGITTPGRSGEVFLIVKSTPVYEGSKNNQVAILETDFPKVATAFSKLYRSAQSPVWFKDGKSLHVYFQYEGNKVWAAFTLKGGLIYAITDLTASSLPEIIKETVSDKYPSYIVADMKQIRTADITVYRVVLESSDEFIMIQADEEEIIEIERLWKLWTPA